jgi:uncharacterized protein YciI
MKFVLWGTYCADVLEKRTPFREEHLSGLRRQKEAGVLLTIGPTQDISHVFGLYEAGSQEEVEALVKGDVYWLEGIWTAVTVHPWIQAL